MMNMVSMRGIAFAGLCAFALSSSPAFALQTSPTGEKVITKNIRPGEECDKSEESDTVIVVCAVEEDPYRIPKNRRNDPNKPENQAWTERVEGFKDVGASGIGSCSPVGPAGALGCTTRLIDNAFAEKKNSPGTQASKLIEEERQKRLAKIDEEAALIQAAELERASENARLAREAEERAARGEEDIFAGEEARDLPPPPQ
jgi:hypothetical protein